MPAVPDEMVDVVDTDDRVLRQATRAEMRRDRLRHRCVFVVVRSTAGDVLIHRRSDDKDLWPGRWDLAVGGVVTAGERYEDAARRELAEEVGVTATDLQVLGGGSYHDGDVSLVGRVFSVTSDGPFEFTDDEVTEARFAALAEVRESVGDGRFVPDSVAVVLPLL